MLQVNTKNIAGKILLPALTLIYFLFQLWNFFYTPLSPDELWFLKTGERVYNSFKSYQGLNIFGPINEMGYGALYWFIQAFSALLTELFHMETNAYFYPIRVLAFLATMSVPLMLGAPWLFSRFDEQARTPAQLLYFVLPMSWWMGKISGPEVFSQALGVLGLGLLFSQVRKKEIGTGIAIGLACGIKLNALVFGIFALVWVMSRRNWKHTAQFVFFCIIGFCFSNLFLLTHPQDFVFVPVVTVPDFYGHSADVLWGRRWAWDMVFSGSLFAWGLAAVLASVLVMTTKKNRSVKMGVVASSGVLTLLIVLNGQYYGWYWFPIFPILVIALMFTSLENRRRRVVFVIFLIIGFIQTAALVQKNWQVKSTVSATLNDGQLHDEIQNCKKTNVAGTIIDFSTPMGHTAGDFFKTDSSGVWVHGYPAYHWLAGHTDPSFKSAAFVIYNKITAPLLKRELQFIKELEEGHVNYKECPLSSNDIRFLSLF